LRSATGISRAGPPLVPTSSPLKKYIDYHTYETVVVVLNTSFSFVVQGYYHLYPISKKLRKSKKWRKLKSDMEKISAKKVRESKKAIATFADEETPGFFQKVATGYIVIIIVKEPRVFIQKVATGYFGVFFVKVISMYPLFTL